VARAAVFHVAVALSLLVLVACETPDDREHKAKLEALVSRSAARAEVARELGSGFTMYEKDTPSWDDLQSFLNREPASDLKPLRANVTKYPKVMYYTTAWRMTWIFLDDKDVIREYYLTAQ
jgi:hypothetical protein